MQINIVVILALLHGLVCDQPDWKNYVKQKEASYQQWAKDNDNQDRARWLNEKFICFSEPKTEKEVKEIIYFIALYKEWNETPPDSMKTVVEKYAAMFKDVEGPLNLASVTDKVLVGLGHKAVPVKFEGKLLEVKLKIEDSAPVFDELQLDKLQRRPCCFLVAEIS